MRYKILSVIVGVTILLPLVVPTTGYAKNFYSFFRRGNYYGIRANISAPSTPPTIPYTWDSTGTYQTGQSHSLTTPGGPSWAQIGISYYAGTGTEPRQYYEYLSISLGYNRVPFGYQAWGTSVKYEVSHNGSQTWCFYVGGQTIPLDCIPNTDEAPNLMSAQSEVHFDPNTRIQTQFTQIGVKNSSGSWVNPGVSSTYMTKYFPYTYTVDSSSSFSTGRSSTTDRYIPSVTECDICYSNP